MTGGDGSTWVKNADGSVTITTKGGRTYRYGADDGAGGVMYRPENKKRTEQGGEDGGAAEPTGQSGAGIPAAQFNSLSAYLDSALKNRQYEYVTMAVQNRWGDLDADQQTEIRTLLNRYGIDLLGE